MERSCWLDYFLIRLIGDREQNDYHGKNPTAENLQGGDRRYRDSESGEHTYSSGPRGQVTFSPGLCHGVSIAELWPVVWGNLPSGRE